MSGLIYKSEQFCRIKKIINNGKRVFLIDCSDTEIINILSASIKNKSLNDVEIWHSIGTIQQDDTPFYISKDDLLLKRFRWIAQIWVRTFIASTFLKV